MVFPIMVAAVTERLGKDFKRDPYMLREKIYGGT
jgi:hypothetical protein